VSALQGFYEATRLPPLPIGWDLLSK
jgi:hypothetical protein